MNTTATSTSRIEKLRGALPDSPGSDDYLAALEKTLTKEKDFHRLFDAKLIRVRKDMGLDLSQPTSLETIPKDQEQTFRDAYVMAAREVGTLFQDNGQSGMRGPISEP